MVVPYLTLFLALVRTGASLVREMFKAFISPFRVNMTIVRIIVIHLCCKD